MSRDATGPIVAWLLRACDDARHDVIRAVERSADEAASALLPALIIPRGDALAAGLFLEYCRGVPICPLEAHWLLGDPAAASERAVLPLCVEMMIDDASRRPRGASAQRPRPAPGRSADVRSRRSEEPRAARSRAPDVPARRDL